MSSPAYYFGLAEIPELPWGWVKQAYPDEFLRVKSPSGELYYATSEGLVPIKVCPPEGIRGSLLQPGQEYSAEEEMRPWPEQGGGR